MTGKGIGDHPVVQGPLFPQWEASIRLNSLFSQCRATAEALIWDLSHFPRESPEVLNRLIVLDLLSKEFFRARGAFDRGEYHTQDTVIVSFTEKDPEVETSEEPKDSDPEVSSGGVSPLS